MWWGNIRVLIWDDATKTVPNRQSDPNFPILTADIEVNKWNEKIGLHLFDNV